MGATIEDHKAFQLESQGLRKSGRSSKLVLVLKLWAGFVLLLFLAQYCYPFEPLHTLKPFVPVLVTSDEHQSCAERFSASQLQALDHNFESQHEITETLFLENPSPEILANSLHKYTKHPHLAGNLALARVTRDAWLSLGLEDVEIVEYEVLLNYPTNKSQVSLLQHDKKVWSATLKEDYLPEDPGSKEEVPFFHGYSKNGSANGALIYLNYGRPQDFEAVVNTGISLKGKIGICRYGKLFRGLKVELAQRYDMNAMLLYDDPSEDHDITIENGFQAYPHGPARNPSSVQRGSVQFLSVTPGDPTTPGYPSLPGCDRQDPYKSTPSIPSIPLSARDAAYLLKTLNGEGEVLAGFTGALPGVKYSTGSAKSAFKIDLDNVQDYDYRSIYNVIGKIEGHFEDTVILGNHRDAWVRGAADPNSGSAALDSVVGTFAALQRTGYVPLRSLVFASWDAEEYGLVGSTEWVEEHAKDLSKHAIAYLNVDVASSGVDISVAASPLLYSAILNVTEKVPGVLGDTKLPGAPGVPLKSLREEWSGSIRTLGSGSDYTAFQDALGITSADMGFQSGKHSNAVYHYHSQYDSYHWLTKFGDPGLRGLQASTRLWGLLAYRLTESPVIAFNATLYGSELVGYVQDLIKSSTEDLSDATIKKSSIKSELKNLLKTAKSIAHYGQDLDGRAAHTNGQVSKWADLSDPEKISLLQTIHHLNDEYKGLERGFLDPRGLPDRSFFKHVLYAPGRWTGYAGAIFPSIVEAKSVSDMRTAIRRVTKILKRVGSGHKSEKHKKKKNKKNKKEETDETLEKDESKDKEKKE